MNLPGRTNKCHKLSDELECMNGPGAYVIYLAKGSIPRRLGADKNAIMYIGETTTVKARMRKFCNGLANDKGGHVAANHLRWLNGLQPPRRQVQLAHLKYICEPRGNKEAAKGLQDDWLKQYAKKFGELPPLNGQRPGSE